ncbi:MAG: glycosyltransferase family 4 protein [Nocardioidaceae bacterium]
MLPRECVRQVLSHCASPSCVHRCTSRSGIVNLEAMACETAVVASAVGGIPEVVVDGETGLLVPYTPQEPARFESALAAGVNDLANDPELARRFGVAGRERAVSAFDWGATAAQTAELYRSLR